MDEKEAVLIGGLDGSLFEWKYSELTTPSIFVLNLNGGITSLKINGDLIMASTTSGIIYFLSRNYEIKYEFTAHHPQTDHDKEVHLNKKFLKAFLIIYFNKNSFK